MSRPETGHYILETTDSRDIEEGVTVDLDEKGHIVGIEILDANDKLELSELVNKIFLWKNSLHPGNSYIVVNAYSGHPLKKPRICLPNGHRIGYTFH